MGGNNSWSLDLLRVNDLTVRLHSINSQLCFDAGLGNGCQLYYHIVVLHRAFGGVLVLRPDSEVQVGRIAWSPRQIRGHWKLHYNLIRLCICVYVLCIWYIRKQLSYLVSQTGPSVVVGPTHCQRSKKVVFSP